MGKTVFEEKDYEFYFEERKHNLNRLKYITHGFAILTLLAMLIIGIIDSGNELMEKYGVFMQDSKFENFAMWALLGFVIAIIEYFLMQIPVQLCKIQDANMRVLLYEVNEIKEKFNANLMNENGEDEAVDIDQHAWVVVGVNKKSLGVPKLFFLQIKLFSELLADSKYSYSVVINSYHYANKGSFVFYINNTLFKKQFLTFLERKGHRTWILRLGL